MRDRVFALSVIILSSWCTLDTPAFAQESLLDGLKSAAKTSPMDPSAALSLGRAMRRAGHPIDALNELRRGIAVSAAKPDVLLQLHWEVARVHMDRRDYIQATTACDVLGKLPGAGAEGHACKAHALLVLQRSTEALGEAATALQKAPSLYEAKVAEGRAQELALENAKSEAAYRGALAMRADGVEAHLGLGRVLVRGGHQDDGVAELRKALALDPNGPGTLYELAQVLGPVPESAALLEHATRERPSFGDAWLALGNQSLAAGKLADAKRAAEAADRNDPGNAAPKVLAGRVALAENRVDDAIRLGEAALKLLANSAPAKLLVADGNAKKGELDLALEAYQAAWGLDHGDPTPLVHASEACHVAGRDTSAKAFGLKAAQEFPKWGPSWAALGDALVAQGDKAGAKDAYSKALAADGPVDKAALQRKLGAL